MLMDAPEINRLALRLGNVVTIGMYSEHGVTGYELGVDSFRSGQVYPESISVWHNGATVQMPVRYSIGSVEELDAGRGKKVVKRPCSVM